MASRPACVLPGEPNWASGVNNSPSASNSWSSIRKAYRARSSAISARDSRRAIRRSRGSSAMSPLLGPGSRPRADAAPGGGGIRMRYRRSALAFLPELLKLGAVVADPDVVARRVRHQRADVLRRDQLGRQVRVQDRHALELAGHRVDLTVGDDRQRVRGPDVL